MLIEKSRISNSLLMFLISGYLIGTSAFIAIMDSISFHDSWLVIVTSYFISIPLILTYIVLIKRFPGENLIQILEFSYGPYVGKFISLMYCLFFFWEFTLYITQMGIFYSSLIMPETPQSVFILIFALVCAYAVKNGIEGIVRMSPLITTFCIIAIIGTFLLLLHHMDFTNFLPILEIPMSTFVHSNHLIIVFFGSVIVLLMVLPDSNDIKKIWKYVFWGVTIGAVSLVALSIRNTAIVGAASTIYSDASYQAVRHIDIGGFIMRIEILVGIGNTISLFLATSVMLYATIKSTSQLLRLRSLNTLILPIVGIAVVIAFNVHESSVYMFNDAVNYYPFIAVPVVIIFPVLALFLAKIRKLPKQKGGEGK